MDQNLKQQIIERFHLELLAPEEQDEIMNDAGAVIMESVLTRTIPMLSEEDGVTCDELLASEADITKVFDFIKSKVPRFQEIVDSELDMLDKTLVG